MTALRSPAPSLPDAPQTPPRVAWPVFHDGFRRAARQGQHCVFIGPTGSGKTVAARTLARDRQFVVVLGTKPRDDEMDAYIDEGYERVTEWPPPSKATRPDEYGAVRLVLWPKIRKREELRQHRAMFARCLDDVFVDGGWCVMADEGLWLSDRKGLDLGDHLNAISYGARSMKVTLMMLLQRPAGVPRNTWANATHVFVWNHGVTSDTREIASLGTNSPKDVMMAVRKLQGYEFLYVPARAGSGWAVSQVDIATP